MKKITSYLKAMRSPFFTGTIIPITLGAVIAKGEAGGFNWWLFALTLIGGMALHGGCNAINDYFDHKSGTDELNQDFAHPFTGGSRVIQMGILTPRQVLLEALVLYAVGSLIGLYLAYVCGLWVLWIGLFGVVTSYFYTAPPFRLVHHGIGEIFIGLNFGILMTLGSYFVQARFVALTPVVAAIPVAFLITNILYINEFQDLTSDRAVGKLNWVARLGRKRGATGFALFWVGTYLSIILGVALGFIPRLALVSLLTIPFALKAIRIVYNNFDTPEKIEPANAMTIALHLVIGLILISSFLL